MAPPRDYPSWEDFDADEGDLEPLPLPASEEDEAGDVGDSDADAAPRSVEDVLAALPADDPQAARLRKIAALAKETERIRGEMATLAGKDPAPDPRYPAFTDAKGARASERERLAALERLRTRARDAVVAGRAAVERGALLDRGAARRDGGGADAGRADLARIRDEVLAAGRAAAGAPGDAVRGRTGRQYAAWRDRWSGVEDELRTVTTEAKTGPGRMRLAERGLDRVRGLPAAARLTRALPEAARALPVVAALTRPGESRRGLTDRGEPSRTPLAERLRGLTEPRGPRAPAEDRDARREAAPSGDPPAADPYARDAGRDSARENPDAREPDEADASDAPADPAPRDASAPRDAGAGADADSDSDPDSEADPESRQAARAARRARAREDRQWGRDARARGEDRSAVRDELRERRRARHEDARSARRSDRD